MPVNVGRLVFGRILAIAAFVLAIFLCFVLLLNAASDEYTVRAVVSDAGQLVEGNEIQVGGVPVGSVKSIEVSEDKRAAELELSVNDEFAPLHEGTTATIRNPSLTSVAGRYVSLIPGPNDAPEIRDDGEIPTEDTTEIVDLDQVLNALDPRTVRALSQVVHGSAEASSGRGRQLARAIESLNPALSRSAVALGELSRDQGALEQLVVSTAQVSGALASRRDQVASGTAAASQALGAIAAERERLSSSLAKAPPTLRRAVPTLASVRGLLSDLEPAVPEARPLARGLSDLLPRLRPVSAALRGLLPELRTVVRAPGADNDATELLGRLPQLSGQAVPLLGDLTDTVREARPVLSELRPYLPDLTGGIVGGFGGSEAGYYDANGAYARISFVGGPFSVVGLPRLFTRIGAVRSGATERCPGAANYPVPDGSNPFVDGGVQCTPDLAGSTP
jgi:phospholipid/cholesterol/gamma-HCH transport system substrate-binding protein